MSPAQESKIDRLLVVMGRIDKKLAAVDKVSIEYVPEAEAIRLLGKSKRTLLNMRKNCELGFTSVHGRGIMYVKDDLHKLLYQNSTKFSL